MAEGRRVSGRFYNFLENLTWEAGRRGNQHQDALQSSGRSAFYWHVWGTIIGSGLLGIQTMWKYRNYALGLS